MATQPYRVGAVLRDAEGGPREQSHLHCANRSSPSRSLCAGHAGTDDKNAFAVEKGWVLQSGVGCQEDCRASCTTTRSVRMRCLGPRRNIEHRVKRGRNEWFSAGGRENDGFRCDCLFASAAVYLRQEAASVVTRLADR